MWSEYFDEIKSILRLIQNDEENTFINRLKMVIQTGNMLCNFILIHGYIITIIETSTSAGSQTVRCRARWRQILWAIEFSEPAVEWDELTKFYVEIDLQIKRCWVMSYNWKLTGSTGSLTCLRIGRQVPCWPQTGCLGTNRTWPKTVAIIEYIELVCLKSNITDLKLKV